MRKLIENYLPPLLAIIISIFIWKSAIVSFDFCKELIKQFTTIGTCIFGFILTMFSLIIQSNSEAVTRMRKRKIPYNRFVAYNKKVVIYSLAFTLYCYIVGYMDFPKSDVLDSNRIIVAIFWGAFLYYIYEVFYFLIVFYILISESDDTSK